MLARMFFAQQGGVLGQDISDSATSFLGS